MPYRSTTTFRCGSASRDPAKPATVFACEARSALLVYCPDPGIRRLPVDVIREALAGVAPHPPPQGPRQLAAIDAALRGLVDEVGDTFGFGGDALSLELVGDGLVYCASGNARLHRLRGGRVNTLFGGDTAARQALEAGADPLSLSPQHEVFVVSSLGARCAGPAWRGPTPLDVEPGDRLLVTTFPSTAGLTTDDLERALAAPDPERAARAVLARSARAARSEQRSGWFAQALVVDLAAA